MSWVWNWIVTGSPRHSADEKVYIAPHVAPERPSPAIARKYRQLQAAMERDDGFEVARIQASLEQAGIAPPVRLSDCRKVVKNLGR